MRVKMSGMGCKPAGIQCFPLVTAMVNKDPGQTSSQGRGSVGMEMTRSREGMPCAFLFKYCPIIYSPSLFIYTEFSAEKPASQSCYLIDADTSMGAQNLYLLLNCALR